MAEVGFALVLRRLVVLVLILEWHGAAHVIAVLLRMFVAIEARSDDRHAELVLDVLLDHGAENDLHVLAGLLLNDARGLRGLTDAERRAAGDVDEHVGGTGDGEAVEQWTADGLHGGLLRAVLASGRGRAHQGRAAVLHGRLHVGEVEVDQAVNRNQVTDAAGGVVEHLVGLLKRLD